eukprot:1914975-Prymnesium_polylepis.2
MEGIGLRGPERRLAHHRKRATHSQQACSLAALLSTNKEFLMATRYHHDAQRTPRRSASQPS